VFIIKKLKKEFKTHRSAIDFDEKLINHCFWKQHGSTDNGSEVWEQQQKQS
jgi:hypothetical protein